MRLVVTENITLDGVIDASGGWFALSGADGGGVGGGDDTDINDELMRQTRPRL